MSFSDAEEAVLTWEPVDTLGDIDTTDEWAAFQRQKYIAEDFRKLYERISDLKNNVSPWVEKKVSGVDALDEQAAGDQEEFQALYVRLSESYQAVKQSSQELLAEERSHVTEAIKDIEVSAAKLDSKDM
ncbi:hypothetical protein CJF30_00001688 [Rutstroemia sp. NJR-2017a BBW]|nr:hypothetical protein CJF30_00001688 [Rutstroemia sp. NJR-2017a BBW]